MQRVVFDIDMINIYINCLQTLVLIEIFVQYPFHNCGWTTDKCSKPWCMLNICAYLCKRHLLHLCVALLVKNLNS